MAVDEALAAEFADLGVTVEADVDDDERCEVWDVNWPSVLMFLALETQWYCVALGMGGSLLWLGLKYVDAIAMLGLRTKAERRARSDADMMEDLRILEREALAVMNRPAS